MARIALGVYMVRYPLGGMLSLYLALAVGLRRLGHDLTIVERSGWPRSCFDPVARAMTDDCARGVAVVDRLLSRHGLGDRWCFVDAAGGAHGMSRGRMRDALSGCELFLDAGTHGLWLDELGSGATTALLDGEPGWTQMRWAQRRASGDHPPRYDLHLTVGLNVGSEGNPIPTLGLRWHHFLYPVLLDEFAAPDGGPAAPYTTVMNWRAHEPLTFDGRRFGQKDVEFDRFIDLPARIGSARLEVAVAGDDVPRERLERAGWRVLDAHAETAGYDAYRAFVRRSRGEFSVAKNVFVATASGWFSDRSAAYLAAGRPVVVQDTGVSAHLPCGEGLFAVDDVDAAAAAIEAIEGDYERHSDAAREIAREHLSADRAVPRILAVAGL